MRRLLAFVAVLLWATSAQAANRCAPSAAPSGGCTTTHASMAAAIAAAVPGDTVYGHAGTTYTESITLPNKGVLASYITITTDASAGSLPAANVRTGPSYTAFLPAIQSPGGGVSDLYFAAGANHYKFQHVWFKNVPAGFGDIVAFGFADSSQFLESQEPTDAIFDQIYMTGDPIAGQKRGFNLNGKRFTLTNSYIKDIHSVGQDSQCIGGGNGHGPITVINNYLECATENFIQGGFDPPINTKMHVTGTPTTSSADVTVYQSGHTLAELSVGQFIAVQTVAGTPTYNSLQYTTIATITGTGTTGTLMFATPLTVAPVVGGDIRAQVIPNGITFQRNYVTKNTAWFTGALPVPAGPSATGSTANGSLAAGQYCYKVQAFSLNGYQNNTINGPLATEQCATIAATGKVTVAFTAVTGATSYRIWRGTSPGGENQYTSVTAVSTVDDGTLVYTSATPFGATQITTKNLFELKCATNVQVDGNIFIHHRRGSDIGYALWLKTVNQDGTAWGCQTSNVVIEKNIWADINGWLEVHGQEASGNPFPGPLTNLTVRNNLVYGSSYLNGGNIYAFNITQAAKTVTVDHNTVVHVTDGNGGGLMVVDSTQAPLVSFVFQNNMVRSETFGIHDPAGTGDAALVKAAPGFVFRNNGVGAGTAPPYTAANGNVYSNLATWQAAFTVYSDDGSGGANYTIVGGAPGANYRLAGSDAKDLGADIAAVTAATAGVDTGSPSVTVTITTTTLPGGVRTLPYSQQLSASGGTAPYTFARTVGTLPAGVTLSSAGLLSGTPTTTTNYSFSVVATDSMSVASSAQAFTVAILDPVVSTLKAGAPLPNAFLVTDYHETITHSGGVGPWTCALSSGALPTGVVLDPNACTLDGRPSVLGLSSFAILISDSTASTATLNSTIVVSPEPLPPSRPVNDSGPLTREAQVFRRPTAPTNPKDRVASGDIWIDTSHNPPVVNIANDAVPTWAPILTSPIQTPDGSTITNLNASNLASGTIPAAVFPANLAITSSVTTPTVTATNENIAGYVDLAATNCNAVAGAGHARLCQDAATNVTLISQNGAAYTPLVVTSSGGATSTLPAITSVNNIATVGNGVTGVVYKAGPFLGVNGNVVVTNAVSGTIQALYRVCAAQTITVADAVSSTLPALTITWANSVSAALTTTLLPTSSGNTVGTRTQACQNFLMAPGKILKWDVGTTSGAYASNTPAAMTFDFILTVELIN